MRMHTYKMCAARSLAPAPSQQSGADLGAAPRVSALAEVNLGIANLPGPGVLAPPAEVLIGTSGCAELLKATGCY